LGLESGGAGWLSTFVPWLTRCWAHLQMGQAGAGSLVHGQTSLEIVIVDSTWKKIIGRNDDGIFVKRCEFEIS
jgi:hypothetical protein